PTHETESLLRRHRPRLASADQSRSPALRYRPPSFLRARRSKPLSPAAVHSRLWAAPDGVSFNRATSNLDLPLCCLLLLRLLRPLEPGDHVCWGCPRTSPRRTQPLIRNSLSR
ncbi:unnamed protein product, partial [Ectocarpus sp. 8 AP-2014]